MKKIYKYATGDEIPEGAVYLKTVVQTKKVDSPPGHYMVYDTWLVWHYFLVEVKDEPPKSPLK